MSAPSNPKPSPMSPEAQRIAIAESLGTHRIERGVQDPQEHYHCLGTLFTDAHGRRKFVSDSKAPSLEWQHREFTPLPDYLSDLNAIQSAIKPFLRSHRDQLLREIKSIRGEDWGFATAGEWSESLLRTIGKWEGGTDEP